MPCCPDQTCLASRAETSSAPPLQFQHPASAQWGLATGTGTAGAPVKWDDRAKQRGVISGRGGVNASAQSMPLTKTLLSVMQQSWALSVKPCAIPAVQDACQLCCEALLRPWAARHNCKGFGAASAARFSMSGLKWEDQGNNSSNCRAGSNLFKCETFQEEVQERKTPPPPP